MTPQDQEEHRLAALAAGYEIRFLSDMDGGDAMIKGSTGVWGVWSPLTIKSDSFDLMLACNIAFRSEEKSSRVAGYMILADKVQRICEHVVYISGDISTKEQSAMLAIFRCAVEIGKAMESKQ